MQRKALGRALRRHPLTARLLTEYRVYRMANTGRAADLMRCREFARPGSIAIDVGASVGNYALAMSKSVGRRGRVIALEANPAVFAELVRSTWFSPVTPLNLAASSRSGRRRMNVPVDSTGALMEQLGSLEPRHDRSSQQFDVQCVRLDDIIYDTRSVSLVKIDVEGHEHDVLLGASALLERHHPALVIEIEQRHLLGRSVADSVEWLVERGYSCYGINGNNLIPWSRYDVERDQLQWLSEDKSTILNIAHYINNFLFIRRDELSAPDQPRG